MKKITFITLLAISTLGMAHADLTVVQDLGGVPLSQYVNMNVVPNGQTLQTALGSVQAEISTINTSTLLLPQPQTEFTPGIVIKHPISTKLPLPFYLIGGDDQSIVWATQNAAYLKSIGAQGFIVDVTSSDQLQAVEAKTGLALMPGNVVGLSSVVGTNHYPFLVYQGWVSQ